MLRRFWQASATRRLSIKLTLAAVLMFVFALFIMPPLYNLFCDITGLNGKTGGPFAGSVQGQDTLGVDRSRQINIQFIAHNNASMPWEFEPVVKTLAVHPGEMAEVHYLAHNPTGQAMVAQAVPSVVPYKAANYFHKTECFCFEQQPLAAGEQAQLGLSFMVDIDIPKQVHTITLSYTLFDITEKQALVQSRTKN
ncbi:MAG: cytochrome c oxidase assembly protein [Cellvibrionaceae bacterium]|nr:cytochrome c oxidase assembly protein [Cellvibrionaceae bacterium]